MVLIKKGNSVIKKGMILAVILKISRQNPGRGGKRVHWAVYYTSPQSFMITFSYSLASKILGILIEFDWLIN